MTATGLELMTTCNLGLFIHPDELLLIFFSLWAGTFEAEMDTVTELAIRKLLDSSISLIICTFIGKRVVYSSSAMSFKFLLLPQLLVFDKP